MTQVPDAHSLSAEHGSPIFFVPPEALPELAEVPLELPEPPVHSDAQFASTHDSASVASEFWACWMHV